MESRFLLRLSSKGKMTGILDPLDQCPNAWERNEHSAPMGCGLEVTPAASHVEMNGKTNQSCFASISISHS